jgi:hypothetical protein
MRDATLMIDSDDDDAAIGAARANNHRKRKKSEICGGRLYYHNWYACNGRRSLGQSCVSTLTERLL